jgi:hypothetical protein
MVIENIKEKDLETALPFRLSKNFIKITKLVLFFCILIKAVCLPFMYYIKWEEAYLGFICYYTAFLYGILFVYHLIYNKIEGKLFLGATFYFLYNIIICYILEPAPVIYMFKRLI